MSHSLRVNKHEQLKSKNTNNGEIPGHIHIRVAKKNDAITNFIIVS